MDAPPVQYVTAADGMSIAYSERGEGTPVLWMPFMWNNLQYMTWRGDTRPFFDRLAQHHRVVVYDSRGQGCSARGLSAAHTGRDFELDVEALADGLNLGRFAISAVGFLGHVALRYAVSHPERVSGLILRNVRLDYADEVGFVLMAESNWDLFVDNRSRLAFPTTPLDRAARLIRESVTQADWLIMGKSVCESSLSPHDMVAQAPALVLADTSRAQMMSDAMVLAASIPSSRLVTYNPRDLVYDGRTGGSEPTLLATMLEFLAGLPAPAAIEPLATEDASQGLSSRQLEVLRLIAAGRSNAQIAEALVISPNTVGRHVSNIFDKTGAANRAEATAYAMRHGLA
jgi:DNA-binding CsgD family transcriptional regulator